MSYEMYEDFCELVKKWKELGSQISKLKREKKKKKGKEKRKLELELAKTKHERFITQMKLMRHPYFKFLLKTIGAKQTWMCIWNLSIPRIYDKDIICKLIGWCK